MANSALIQLALKALPALSGSALTYNAKHNLYLTTGYTSASNNTYFKAVRFSPRLAVHFDIGEGYVHTFLNGITLYAWDGTKASMIGRRFYGGCDNWRPFSESFAKKEAIEILKDYLLGQAKLSGDHIPEQQVLSFSREMVEEMENYQRQIA
ncbi:MAG: hypothetical protein K2M63_00735 [Muribaculaceae bacterium]|nr:hypothetical protein [Muribaculaceae bacterium]